MSKLLERLRELQSGDSVSAFARTLEMPQKTIDSYLKGERKASIELVLRVCAKYGVSSDWLLGLSDVRTASSQAHAAGQKCQNVIDPTSEILSELKSLDRRLRALEASPAAISAS